jgi:hypothetical protein
MIVWQKLSAVLAEITSHASAGEMCHSCIWRWLVRLRSATFERLVRDPAQHTMPAMAGQRVRMAERLVELSNRDPTNPTAYASAMIAAERGNWVSEDMVGGVYGKVVRWAFEKQGLYQPPGAPTPVKTVGAPPAVDLHIDDCRHGEYGFQEKFWETQDIWNCIEPDGQTGHQTPLVCHKNHAYVRVKNRDTQTSKGARVYTPTTAGRAPGWCGPMTSSP